MKPTVRYARSIIRWMSGQRCIARLITVASLRKSPLKVTLIDFLPLGMVCVHIMVGFSSVTRNTFVDFTSC